MTGGQPAGGDKPPAQPAAAGAAQASFLPGAAPPYANMPGMLAIMTSAATGGNSTIPPPPPAVLEELRRMQTSPQMATVRQRFEELLRYQKEVGMLSKSDPLFAQKLAQIPKPDMTQMTMPELSPAMRAVLGQWIASSPRLRAVLQQQQEQAWQMQDRLQQEMAVQQRRAAAAPGAANPRVVQTGAPALGPPPAAPLRPAAPRPITTMLRPPPPRKPLPVAPQPALPAPKPAPPAAKPAPPVPKPVPPAPKPLRVAPKPVPPAPQASPPAVTPAAAAAPKPGSPFSGSDGDGGVTEVPVVCNGLPGTFLVERQMMACYCPVCTSRAEKEGLRRIVVSPSEYERHAGSGASKKWRWTVHTADDPRVTLGDWLTKHNLDQPRGRLGRSPFAAKQRKAAQQAEEEEASRELLGPRRGRGRRRAGSEDLSVSDYADLKKEEEEEEEEEEGGTPHARFGGFGSAARLPGGRSTTPPRGGAGGAGRGQGAAAGAQGKKHRQLRWIRRSADTSPEPGEGEEAGGVDVAALLGDLQGMEDEEEGGGGAAPHLPLLLPLQRAADAAEAAAAAQARQDAVAGSAVGPRLLGLPPVAVQRPGTGRSRLGGNGNEEQAGLRSPTGKPWLQADHAMHEEHEGTDMRLGKEYQAALPAYQGPPPALGPSAEAQEPIAALPGPPEAEALASAAGPEKEQAAALPRDATADVWLREVADHVRATVTGRQQRHRKQSRWLQETFDPNAVLGGKALVERRFEEDDAKDRFMVGRQASARSGQDLAGGGAAAAAASIGPEVLKWTVVRYNDGSQALEVRLALGGTVYAGTLPASGDAGGGRPRGTDDAVALAAEAALATAAAAAVAPPPLREPAPSLGGEPGSARGLLPAVSGVSLASGQLQQGETPRGGMSLAATAATAGGGGGGAAPSNLGPGRDGGGGGGGGGAAVQSYLEGESQPGASSDKRAAAEARFQRMEHVGAPAGTQCALCHAADTDDISEEARGLGGRSQRGLGQMILVRVSAVAHAWVHDQCARWSPEVYDPEGNNRLEGMRDAVRRGRMLRCKCCGNKGATLGCFKRTCRASYHLACARKYHCLLQVEPYLVACPEHVDELPAPYNIAVGAGGAPVPAPALPAAAPTAAPAVSGVAKPAGSAPRAPKGAGSGGGRVRPRSGSRAGKGRGQRGSSWGAGGDSDSEAGMEEYESEESSQEEGEESGADEADMEPPPAKRQRQAAAAAAGDPPGAADLVAQLTALNQQLEQHQQLAAAAVPAAAAAAAGAPSLHRVPPPLPRVPPPLPIPGLPVSVPGEAWTRERIVEAPQLAAEVAAEIAARTKAVVVNCEGEHFRFRAFHKAQDVTPAVQDDSDAILLLDASLERAAAGWPHTHAFPHLSPAEQAAAFEELLLDEQERQAKAGII